MAFSAAPNAYSLLRTLPNPGPGTNTKTEAPMAQTPETDVAIVGGGPVGLGLAMELARRGVRTQVLERSTELHAIPKGQNLTQRTGEHFRAWGIGDAVRTASPIPPDFGNSGLVAYRQLLSPYSYDWFQRSTVRPYYFADNERLPQYALERVMRARVARIGEIGFQTGAQVTQVQQDDDGVCVTDRKSVV